MQMPAPHRALLANLLEIDPATGKAVVNNRSIFEAMGLCKGSGSADFVRFSNNLVLQVKDITKVRAPRHPVRTRGSETRGRTLRPWKKNAARNAP